MTQQVPFPSLEKHPDHVTSPGPAWSWRQKLQRPELCTAPSSHHTEPEHSPKPTPQNPPFRRVIRGLQGVGR